MDTRQGNRQNDDLLVSWKDIATYLKCSVRKAQRLQRQELPVNRITGTKSVWASKSQIDRWLTSQAERAKCRQTRFATSNIPKLADAGLFQVSLSKQTHENGPAYRDSGTTALPASGVMRTFSGIGARIQLLVFRGRFWLLGISLGLAAVASVRSAYGLTIVLFGLTAVLMAVAYPSLPDTSYTRATAGLFVIAAMSYGASATTLPDLRGSVVNMMTLQPALAYPFLTGLRFIPIPVLTTIALVFVPFRDNIGFARNPRLGTAYLFGGALFLFITAVVALNASGAHRIWQAGLPIRWTLLAGESFVFAINLALFALGYRFFNTASIRNYHQLLFWYGIAYVLIALTAAIINRHWNDIDKYYLGVRRPEVYRPQKANGSDEWREWLQQHTKEAGPDLVSLFNDPEFLHALQTQRFYKQPFDDAFQASRKAVIFGYKRSVDSGRQQPAFVRIRFPAALAAVLGFEPVGP